MRILHLTSDFDGKHGLCIEKENGLKEVIDPETLKDLLLSETPLETFMNEPCKIKLVVLLIPNSGELADAFADIGVDHVIGFESV